MPAAFSGSASGYGSGTPASEAPLPAFDSLFAQVAAVLVVSVLLGLVATLLRQPLVVAFIAAGIIVGPDVLGVVEGPGEIELLAKIGISLLLFLVGLKLDLRQIRVIGPVATATGLGQMVFTAAIGFVLTRLLGYENKPALFIALALTFSSTIIIVKMLSDRRELEELHGRIAIGYLIVQDIAVIIVIIVLTAFDAAGGSGPLDQAFGVFVRGAVLLGGVGAMIRWVLPAVLHRMARHAELLLLFAIAWAIGLASLSVALGFSEEVGAFLAGVALASTPYRDAIGGRMTSLRDFLLLFFFIELGTNLELSVIGGALTAAIVLSVFVLVAKPLLIMAITGAMGYRKRVFSLAGLTAGQISEFSLILAALALDLGHIDQEAAGLVTTVALITIAASTYVIHYSHRIHERISPFLSIFERPAPTTGADESIDAHAPDAIVIGLGRLGREIVEELHQRGLAILGVDFDPGRVRAWNREQIPVLYGDAEDPELPAALPFATAVWVVSTVRRVDTNRAIMHAFRHHGYDGSIAVSADNDDDATRLEEAGADLVLQPFRTAAAPIVRRLVNDT